MASLLQSSRPRDSLLFPRTSQMMILHEHLKDGERDFVYIRSLTRRMFDRIRELRCTKCTTLLSSRTPPWTGPCGHFFCNDHKGINFTTNPDDVYEKHHVCDESGEVPIPSSRTGSVTNNLLLRDVHSAMATRSAFSCVDCKGIHPIHNSVGCTQCPLSNGGDRIVCVWCAAKKHKDDRHRFRHVEESDEVSPRAPGALLHSLDVLDFPLICAFLHCAACAQPLVPKNVEGTVQVQVRGEFVAASVRKYDT
ncbi:hypothetical protein PFISCL1PPCAC_20894 [Pristionchus fissidentatus]|uniref:ZZ-type domain-containing protein n=1 Tax=Pristionchus fissidentatus TaxID=1538716 RepID=A0AAV5WF30_9BILA|nr:hypothetical protein PFISCL1PPCAC_20894 [Pristionchus fissidentatus]